jgi:hypothetical protein
MALRLIEMVLPEQDGEEVLELLKKHKMLEHRQIRLSDGEVLVRILLDAEQSAAVLDLLGERYAGKEGNRVVILAVEATLPRASQRRPLPPNNCRRKNHRSGSAGRSCMRTSKMLRSVRGFIWRWWCCPPSWRPLVCITTA